MIASPLGLAAIGAPLAVTSLITGLGRRHDRLARKFQREQARAAKLKKAAYHDSLTGLRNRHALSEDVGRILGRSDPRTRAMTLMLFDLDRFKFINDTMGHAAGDAVLKALAQRLQDFCGEARRVYRLGGDEFVVLIDGPVSAEELSRFCDDLTLAVFRPVSFGTSEIDTGGSIGIVMGEGAAVGLSDLLKRADLALYRAKSQPGSRYCFFSEDLDSDNRRQRDLEAAMREGVADGAFAVEYLPVVKSATLAPSGFKARLRWDHPEFGDIAPHEFTPMAESSGLIVLIGKWMLGKALIDATEWSERAEITVPVSTLQLQDPSFSAFVLGKLAETGVAPERLVLDIRANSSRGDCPVALVNLRKLRDGGVRIAVSELTASVAGLSMTRPYPVHRVRIDMGRLRAIAGEKRMPQMLNLFLQLANTVGTPVTLTGVDNEHDLETACAFGPDEVQGAFAGSAMCAEQAGVFFKSMGGQAEEADDAAKPDNLIPFNRAVRP